MLKKILCLMSAFILPILVFGACTAPDDGVKIGVSFGVGMAARWEKEKVFMENQAKTLGVHIEIRLNRGDTDKTQQDDCIEMIDSGIDVLILTPRDVNKVSEILDYAKLKNVPVISYARIVLGFPIDYFVGYDSTRIGQSMGQYLTESVYEGDYIILSGDPVDNNAGLLYKGAMRYIDEIKDNITVLLDAPVPGWSAAEAKQLVLDAVSANGNHVDAILAPNDAIAGACAEALAELGIPAQDVVITGMDADIDALKRIAACTQDMTIYMDLKELATTAINEAVAFARHETPQVNTEFDNQSENPIPSNLITGQLITKENLDKLLIDTGIFSREEIYGQ